MQLNSIINGFDPLNDPLNNNEGEGVTAGYLKVRGSAEARLRKTLIEADTPLDYNDIHDKLVAGLKLLFHRIKKNEAWTSDAMDKVKLAMDRYDEIIAAMKLEVSTKRRPAAQREDFEEATGMYITQLRNAYQHGKVGEPPRALLFSTDLPLYQGKGIPLAKPPKGKKDGISWIRRKNNYALADLRNAHAQEKAENYGVSGYHYEATLDGARVKYWPNNGDTLYALCGRIEIEAPGKTKQSAAQVFQAIDALGIDSTRGYRGGRRGPVPAQDRLYAQARQKL